MGKTINVKFSFVNDNGIKKTVKVWIDNGMWEDLQKVSEVERTKYLREEYYIQNRERKISRRTYNYSDIETESTEFELVDKASEERKELLDMVEEVLSLIDDEEDRQLIIDRFLKEMKITTLAKRYNVSTYTISVRLKEIIKSIQNKINLK